MAPTETEALDTWRLLVRTLHRARHLMHPVFREHDLNGARYGVLRHLTEAGEDGLRLSEIGARMFVTPGNVTGLVDQLEKLGCATRHQDPQDRRSTILRITPAGREIVESIQPVLARKAAELLGCLDADETTSLRSTLEKISERTLELAEEGCGPAGDPAN